MEVYMITVRTHNNFNYNDYNYGFDIGEGKCYLYKSKDKAINVFKQIVNEERENIMWGYKKMSKQYQYNNKKTLNKEIDEFYKGHREKVYELFTSDKGKEFCRIKLTAMTIVE